MLLISFTQRDTKHRNIEQCWIGLEKTDALQKLCMTNADGGTERLAQQEVPTAFQAAYLFEGGGEGFSEKQISPFCDCT